MEKAARFERWSGTFFFFLFSPSPFGVHRNFAPLRRMTAQTNRAADVESP